MREYLHGRHILRGERILRVGDQQARLAHHAVADRCYLDRPDACHQRPAAILLCRHLQDNIIIT